MSSHNLGVELLNILWEGWSQCKKCSIGERAKRHVFWRVDRSQGGSTRFVVFIGEAPGKSEDVIGEAFVGPAGRLLDKAIRLAQPSIAPYGIVFTNLLMCRPCDDFGGRNRVPTQEEKENCFPRLKLQLELLYDHFEPFTIFVVLGRTATTFMGEKKLLQDKRVLYLPHPASIFRNGGTSCAEWNPYWRKLQNFLRENL